MASSSLPRGQISSDESEDPDQRRREGNPVRSVTWRRRAGNPVRSVTWRRRAGNPVRSFASVVRASMSEEEKEEETDRYNDDGDGAGSVETEVCYGGGQEEEESSEQRKVNEEWWRHLPLLNATLRGDWETAGRIFEQDKSALTATISETMDTALHVAVGSLGIECIHFVEKLVQLMPADALAAKNSDGRTPLHIAACVGNTEAAKILVDKHPPLLYVNNDRSEGHPPRSTFSERTLSKPILPIHLAALHARRDTLLYLLDVTGNDQGAFNGEYGATILKSLISSNFYDIALDLVRSYPHLATLRLLRDRQWECALDWIAKKVSDFPSGSRLNFWQDIIYHYVPVKDQNKTGDVENNITQPQVMSHMRKDNRAQSFWENISISAIPVPTWLRHIQEVKLRHNQVLRLVKTLCETVSNSAYGDASDYEYARDVMVRAIFAGIPEIIEEIAKHFPGLVLETRNGLNFFQRAIADRNERVFNLVYQMTYHQHVTGTLDRNDNNILHLAGKAPPPNSPVRFPALQVQRELQWFEEVKKFLHPEFREFRNRDGDTPQELFTNKHKDLVAEGGKWLKKTANSCTVPAALIITVAFAAAITVPGGNNGGSGLPIFSDKVAFIVFAVSDAISLFTAATSLLVFLSILTWFPKEADFLYTLPRKLIVGLLTLFLSITTMVVAFSCTLYLMFGQNKAWILIPVVALTCLPITSFITLQFPLIVDLISSTYGKGIFGKKSNRPLYWHDDQHKVDINDGRTLMNNQSLTVPFIRINNL